MKATDRVTFSPGEFAALFGKSQTWGYRQLYAGKVKSITEYGRILIPASEVERILAEAGIYNGEKKRVAKEVSKAELWKRFVSARKAAQSAGGKSKRSAVLARLRPPSARTGEDVKSGSRSPDKNRRALGQFAVGAKDTFCACATLCSRRKCP